MGRLRDKVCVVTGGAQGIGRGIARRFAQEGAAVAVADVAQDLGEKVAADLPALGGSGFFRRTDVSRKEEVQALIAATVAEYGRVDVLVNAAISLAPHTPLEDKTDEMWDYVFKTGFYAAVWSMQAVFPSMRANGGGRIINFDSRANDNGQLNTADYNSTKAAIGGLTRSAAAEWARYNILCNCIAPASASMGFHELVKKRPEMLAETKAFPLGRVGDPETDIAPVALFLASDDARYVTGTTVRVEGGIDLSQAAIFEPDSPDRVSAWLDRRRGATTAPER